MGNTFTIRLPEDIATWLDKSARNAGISRGELVRAELERAMSTSEPAFMRLVGRKLDGAVNLSQRKGFSKE